MLDILIILR